MEQGFVMDDIQMVINELLLDGPIVSLNVGVNLGATRIGKEVRDLVFC